MLGLFLMGLGLIYLIIATQFRSYFQPLLILATIPMAFTGVVFGLLVTGNPLSLYICKYNQLLRIEEMLGSEARFGGTIC